VEKYRDPSGVNRELCRFEPGGFLGEDFGVTPCLEKLTFSKCKIG
jgi:hypothetical protein